MLAKIALILSDKRLGLPRIENAHSFLSRLVHKDYSTAWLRRKLKIQSANVKVKEKGNLSRISNYLDLAVG